jgi:TetR/AcrR family transcriptional regulator, acrAB operon repressor
MPRRTKAEAEATRSRILDAAEQVFHAQGVAGTSLQQIAQVAGVTRGAIYWHFKDKADVFDAMFERVRLPIELGQARLRGDETSSPLQEVRLRMLDILSRVAQDAQLQRVLDIATCKIEYVGELAPVRLRRLKARQSYQLELTQTLRRGQRQGEVVAQPAAAQLAIGVHALLDGLVQNWLLDPAAFDLQAVGARALDIHLAGLRRR